MLYIINILIYRVINTEVSVGTIIIINISQLFIKLGITYKGQYLLIKSASVNAVSAEITVKTKALKRVKSLILILRTFKN